MSSGISPICAPVGRGPAGGGGHSSTAPGGSFVAVPVEAVLGCVKVELKVALTPWASYADEVVAVNGGGLGIMVIYRVKSDAMEDVELSVAGEAVEEESGVVFDAVPEGVAAASANFELEVAAARLDEDVLERLVEAGYIINALAHGQDVSNFNGLTSLPLVQSMRNRCVSANGC